MKQKAIELLDFLIQVKRKIIAFLMTLISFAWKSLKARFVSRLIQGLLIGLISGLIISYFLAIPKIALISTEGKEKKDDLEIKLVFQNVGNSTAQHFKLSNLLGYDGDPEVGFSVNKSNVSDKIEVGDRFEYSIPVYSYSGKNIILLVKIQYEDISFLRENFNKYLLRNDYKIFKWMKYNHLTNNLDMISKDGIKKYERELMPKIILLSEDQN